MAEKLHAYTRGSGDGTIISTRVKDLVDLVLIAELASFDADRLASGPDRRLRRPWEPLAPRNLPLPSALRGARPASAQTTLFHSPSWPQDNEALNPASRRRAAPWCALEDEHAECRSWVWAAPGRLPLAAALEHPATLAA